MHKHCMGQESMMRRMISSVYNLLSLAQCTQVPRCS